VEVEAAPGKPSVCLSLLVDLSSAQLHSPGRVAAGAIAEKYLKLAYGIEIVAFVSSVGKVHLPAAMAPPSLTPINPDEEDDTAHDSLSKDFVTLLGTISREEVDKHPTRCPHPETAERMTKVRHTFLKHNSIIISTRSSRELFVPKMPKIPSVVLSPASFGTFHRALGSLFSTNSKRLLRMRCCLSQQRRPSRSVLDSGVPKSQVVSTMTLLSVTRAVGFEPPQTGVEVFKGGSPMGKMFTLGISIEIITIAENYLFRVGSASSRQPPYLRPRKLHNTMEHLAFWRQGVVMTHVSSLAQSRLSRQWRPL